MPLIVAVRCVLSIFKAGSAYSKIGDMVMRLHPAAQEVNTIEEKQVCQFSLSVLQTIETIQNIDVSNPAVTWKSSH